MLFKFYEKLTNKGPIIGYTLDVKNEDIPLIQKAKALGVQFSKLKSNAIFISLDDAYCLGVWAFSEKDAEIDLEKALTKYEERKAQVKEFHQKIETASSWASKYHNKEATMDDLRKLYAQGIHVEPTTLLTELGKKYGYHYGYGKLLS